jgi:hypothetical protein
MSLAAQPGRTGGRNLPRGFAGASPFPIPPNVKQAPSAAALRSVCLTEPALALAVAVAPGERSGRSADILWAGVCPARLGSLHILNCLGGLEYAPIVASHIDNGVAFSGWYGKRSDVLTRVERRVENTAEKCAFEHSALVVDPNSNSRQPLPASILVMAEIVMVCL